MGEAKVGDEFITHEFDEAIAIHRGIVEAERALAATHPLPEVKRALKGYLKEDERFLSELQALGAEKGATGKVEEVAGSMTELMETTLQSAPEAESEAYEAHAAILQDRGMSPLAGHNHPPPRNAHAFGAEINKCIGVYAVEGNQAAASEAAACKR